MPGALLCGSVLTRIALVAVQHNNVYILAVTKRNSNVTMILTFMMQLVDVSGAAVVWGSVGHKSFLFRCHVVPAAARRS